MYWVGRRFRGNVGRHGGLPLQCRRVPGRRYRMISRDVVASWGVVITRTHARVERFFANHHVTSLSSSLFVAAADVYRLRERPLRMPDKYLTRSRDLLLLVQ